MYYKSKSVLNLKPINKEYEYIKNPDELYNILKNCWSKETCAPRMQDRWSMDNKTLGQCSITAFLAQDIFGGDVYGIPLSDGNFHCFNLVNGIKFDLTSEQFEYPLDYDDVVLQNRDDHFKKKEKYQRYLILKNRI